LRFFDIGTTSDCIARMLGCPAPGARVMARDYERGESTCQPGGA